MGWGVTHLVKRLNLGIPWQSVRIEGFGKRCNQFSIIRNAHFVASHLASGGCSCRTSFDAVLRLYIQPTQIKFGCWLCVFFFFLFVFGV